MKGRKIRFLVTAARWFDRANGNTYHSARIERVSDGAVLMCPIQYGYGDQYRQTALEAMADARWLPVRYRGRNAASGGLLAYSYERENNYPINWTVTDGLKREVVALGSK
jgi:hypothetical protein